MRSLAKLVRLSWRERWLLGQALVALPLNGLALHLCSYGRWQGILARLAPVHGADAQPSLDLQSDVVDRTCRMMRIACTRGLYRGKCLQQSLTLWWLLRRQSVDTEIRFGARKEDGRFDAHAWVEFRGIALNEGPLGHQGFAPAPRATGTSTAR